MILSTQNVNVTSSAPVSQTSNAGEVMEASTIQLSDQNDSSKHEGVTAEQQQQQHHEVGRKTLKRYICFLVCNVNISAEGLVHFEVIFRLSLMSYFLCRNLMQAFPSTAIASQQPQFDVGPSPTKSSK